MPLIDGDEIVDQGWFTPAAALAARERGEIELVFPTSSTSSSSPRFDSADELLAHARGRDVRPVVPHVVRDGEVARIVLPDDAAHAG